jgi:hypothetical protein
MVPQDFRTNIIVLFIFVGFIMLMGISCSDGTQTAKNIQKEKVTGDSHPMSNVIDGFHLPSYYAGSFTTAAEFVSYGCKKIALSAPFTGEVLEVVLPHARREAEKYGIPIYIEKDLLVTKLFSPDVAKDRTVIMFVYRQTVLDEYLALKAFKANAEKEGRLKEVEEEIARKFGKLLSYTDETIEKMLTR